MKPLWPRVSKTVRSDNTMRWDSWEFLFLELVHGQGLWRRAYAGQCKLLDLLQTLRQWVIIFKLVRAEVAYLLGMDLGEAQGSRDDGFEWFWGLGHDIATWSSFFSTTVLQSPLNCLRISSQKPNTSPKNTLKWMQDRCILFWHYHWSMEKWWLAQIWLAPWAEIKSQTTKKI